VSRLELLRPTPAAPDNPAITDAEGAAMARAVLNLFGRWGVTDREGSFLLGEISPRTLARWRSGGIGRLSPDQKARLANLLGIHKALRVIFREPERGYGWIRRANDAFGGRSALEVMLGGAFTDLLRVRTYLDAVRSGG
jgi:uncharacterized protein (DUF2384 family)